MVNWGEAVVVEATLKVPVKDWEPATVKVVIVALDRVVAPVTFRVPVMAVLPVKVAVPVTAKVEAKVAAPVTDRVDWAVTVDWKVAGDLARKVSEEPPPTETVLADNWSNEPKVPEMDLPETALVAVKEAAEMELAETERAVIGPVVKD